MNDRAKYFFIKNSGKSKTIHIWDKNKNNTLCKSWDFLQKLGKYTMTIEIPNGHICKHCQSIIEQKTTHIKKPKGPKMATTRPEEQEYLTRWKGARSHPSLWEKIDRDPVYESALKGRTGPDGKGIIDDNTTMGKHWGIGKPKAPH